MTWETFETKESLAARGLEMVAALAKAGPEAHLCLATGGSPELLYRTVGASGLDASRFWITQLDEWVGMPYGHEGSSEAYLRTEVIGPWKIAEERFLSIRTDAADPQAEIDRAAEALASRPPLDLAIVGVGKNGHLGLNEPSQSLAPWAGIRILEESTRSHGMLEGLADAPTHGMTLGPGDLLKAREILLIIAGAGKEWAAEQVRSGRVTTLCPATFLLLHPRLTVLLGP